MDPWCGYNPKMVACDGTHFGVQLKLLDIKPIEIPDIDLIKKSKHLRYNRVYMPYDDTNDNAITREARAHLLQFSRHILEFISDKQKKVVISCTESSCCSLIYAFLYNLIEVKSFNVQLATVLVFLLRKEPVSSLIPHRYVSMVLLALADLKTGDLNCLQNFTHFAPEIRELFIEAQSVNFMDECCDFIEYLCLFIVSVHNHDDPIVHGSPIDNSYNPENGVALYFSQHGKAIRKLPKYDKNKEYTEQCTLKDRDCSKQFPGVRKGGWSYVFLWFCPDHQHCYGFHIINNAEGRKDPFCALYKYMEEPPHEVFYDFACSLMEYSLNREPSYFRSVRFWHDVFHSRNHVCGPNYRSRRLSNLSSLNTSICEQFNAHLKPLKYIASHLSQPHFTFLLQYFIYMWNQKKTTAYKSLIADIEYSEHH